MNQNYLKRFLLLCFLCVFSLVNAQKNEMMQQYGSDLNALFVSAFSAKTDNERFNSNEQALLLLEEALSQPKSFSYDWPELKSISILKADDNKFKIFTWAIIRDNGEYDCFGFIQVQNPKTEKYDVYSLNDRSSEIFGANDALLSSTTWLGVVYYQLIQTEYKDRKYYTLLGWTGNNLVKQRKVIELISFKGNSTQPIFGQNIFHKEKSRRRVVFEYAKESSMLLRYDFQYFTYKEREVSKNAPVKYVEKKGQQNMIIFDVLEPMQGGMEGVYQYYVPSGNEAGYTFDNGKWVYVEQVVSTSHEKNPKEIKPATVKRPRYYQP